jgi:hypothetical protein
MKKRLLLWHLTMISTIICLSTFSNYTNAQMKYEVGLNIGPSNFLGDLGGNTGKGQTFLKDHQWSTMNLMKGITFNVIPNELFSLRVAINFGKIEGADSLIQGKGGLEEARKARNQHFKSNIFEAYAAAEIYPTALLEGDPSDLRHKFRPYGLFGVGMFKFNPKGQYIDASGNAQWVELQPLRTEGQGMSKHPARESYNLTQINMPYGVGIKYFFSDRVNLSYEIVNRITFTDYMDDVSTTYIADQDFYDFFGATANADIARQMANKSSLLNGGLNRPGYEAGDKRGTSTNNDAYYATTFKLGIRMGRDGSYSYTKQTRCSIIRF